MTILALEFSSDQRSVAVLVPSGRAPGSAHVVWTASETGGRGTRAVHLIESVLALAQLEREQIECMAVGLGPGSYTGIRAAIALAQGWQLGREVRLLGISSVEVLAAQTHAAGLRGPVHIVIDAQRNEFYQASYELEAAGPRETEPLRLASPAELAPQVAAGGTVLGPEVTRWFPAGRVMFPEAAVLAQLAVGRTDFVSGEELKPIYLRPIAFVKAPPPRVLP